ncbi:TPA: hypothetical protein ACPHOR_002025, partial [Haemophilus influenzae]
MFTYGSICSGIEAVSVAWKGLSKPLWFSEEEKDEYCTDLDYVLERPEIVDYPTDNGWIKCSERLPEPNTR